MNINTDFIPVETSTTTTTMTSTTSTAEKITSVITVLTTEKTTALSDDYPPGQKREKIIAGLSELEKDIFIISLSALCLVLVVLLWTICLKWRKSKQEKIHEFQTLSAGSSVSVFNSSKMD